MKIFNFLILLVSAIPCFAAQPSAKPPTQQMQRYVPSARAAAAAPAAIELADVKIKAEPATKDYSQVPGMSSDPALQKHFKAEKMKQLSLKPELSIRALIPLKKRCKELEEVLSARDIEIQKLKFEKARFQKQAEENEAMESQLQLSEQMRISLSQRYVSLRAGLFKCCFCYCTCDDLPPLSANPLSVSQDALDPNSVSSQNY